MGSSPIIVVSMLMVVMVTGQYYDQTTPVPILKQINRHNEDGSYSYGYEAADGSYKIETKHPTGDVVGKYGYVDDTGKVREVEYGASRRGFEPAGTGINVAPPTLTNNYNQGNSLGSDYDDGQYREDPSIYYKSSSFNSAPNRPSYQNTQSRYSQNQQSSSYNPQPSYQERYNSQPSYQERYNSQPSYQERYNPPPQQQYNSPQNQYNSPQQPYYPKIDPNQFRGHPATNFDVYSGSYSVNYSG
ncbi:putative uncharacterized protein DDB_G0284695 [Cryptotermes secundus]|nr:putative uncharacterized protein DDB_G0284695 [Cryptotermes secundus]